MEMSQAGAVQFEFKFNKIPFLAGARTYAQAFIFPGGASNNRLYFGKDVLFSPHFSENEQMLLWDPQTSGGLLLAVPPEKSDLFLNECKQHQQEAWIVGEVKAGEGIVVV